MYISRYATLYLIPLAWLCAVSGMLPISLLHSICGVLFGYLLLYGINAFFVLYKGIHGLGQGDMELLAFIGSFQGIPGVWFSMLGGSLCGCIYIVYKALKGELHAQHAIPFGPFLSCGALIYFFLSHYIDALF
jgi:leader peptidase (prepilin peptidase)/N-methyltransferase